MAVWCIRLREARIAKHLSQKQVADALELTRGCYAHYEQGIREPSIDLIKRICLILDISSDYLIGLSDFK